MALVTTQGYDLGLQPIQEIQRAQAGIDAQKMRGLQAQAMEQGLESRQLGIQSQQRQQVSEQDQAAADAMISGAYQLKSITDPQGKLGFLAQRRAEFEEAGMPTQGVDQALTLARQGDWEGLEARTDDLIALGKQIQRPGQTPRQQEFAQYQALPENTEEQRKLKREYGQLIGAIAKRATPEERAETQRLTGDIKVQQDIAKERGKLIEQTRNIPQRERVSYLSKNREAFQTDIGESKNVLEDIDRAIEIWESAPGTISGPAASRLPSLKADTQELESILAKLGVDRLENFKGNTSERELEVAFRGGASIEQNKEAGLRRLRKQRRDVMRNQDRLQGLLSESNRLLRQEIPPAPEAPPVESTAAPQAAPAQQFQEGQTATNPQTGEKVIYTNGQWQPV